MDSMNPWSELFCVCNNWHGLQTLQHDWAVASATVSVLEQCHIWATSQRYVFRQTTSLTSRGWFPLQQNRPPSSTTITMSLGFHHLLTIYHSRTQEPIVCSIKPTPNHLFSESSQTPPIEFQSFPKPLCPIAQNPNNSHLPDHLLQCHSSPWQINTQELI